MIDRLVRFRNDEAGAVTVDWVVLSAAIIGLAIALLALINAGATETSTSVGSRLSTLTLMSF